MIPTRAPGDTRRHSGTCRAVHRNVSGPQPAVTEVRLRPREWASRPVRRGREQVNGSDPVTANPQTQVLRLRRSVVLSYLKPHGQRSASNPVHNQIEDDDLYAFVHASAAQLAVPLVVVADGRTPWEVFEDKQIIGNSLYRTMK